MKLINTQTRELEEFFESDIPPYAILSHCWGKDEVSYKEYIKSRGILRPSEGAEKIEGLIKLAQQDDISHVWIDTCCIDKRSSAELSEAINSMFKWYQNAKVCYAYLSDVSHITEASSNRSFLESRWFTRGWTLQELIAPTAMYFLDSSWNLIAPRRGKAEEISRRTGIKMALLQDDRDDLSAMLQNCTVAQRMSWAAHRQTSRQEDRAYSLLGLFNVNMPLLYGEGTKAFLRLQQEIMKEATELSMLAWTSSSKDDTLSTLAAGPDNFANCKTLIKDEYVNGSHMEFSMTPSNRDLRISAPALNGMNDEATSIKPVILLSCRDADDPTTTVALKLETLRDGTEGLRLCHRGWRRDEYKHFVFLDIINAAQEAIPWSVALRERPKIRKERSLDWSLVWVRLEGSTLRNACKVIDLYPEQYWNRYNYTFDLVRARQDATAGREATISAKGDTSLGLPVSGAIALKYGPTEMNIYFAQLTTSPHDGIAFGVGPYVKETFGKSGQLSTGRERYWRFPNLRRVFVELHARSTEEQIIAQLSVQVVDGQKSFPGMNEKPSGETSVVEAKSSGSHRRIGLLRRSKRSPSQATDKAS